MEIGGGFDADCGGFSATCRGCEEANFRSELIMTQAKSGQKQTFRTGKICPPFLFDLVCPGLSGH